MVLLDLQGMEPEIGTARRLDLGASDNSDASLLLCGDGDD
ncbi:SapB/AmfS family lanthipeptide [Streptomyces hesseae]|uniref:SapB/AmfS family lanthipeptide n=1 Tax=Streptomyces hesseae TaxID=3075519 RepID=A0ABU2SJ59_9ACTN|nr:SapB/AmfS family lanthipeptide [Streptomyces sp. DSM 40473]MDT0448942.1 SapB/AmfS family lanthipeptide [Streptomyces sp. DSM 40473]